MNSKERPVTDTPSKAKHVVTAAAVAGGAMLGAYAMLLMNNHAGPTGSVLGRDAHAGGIPTIDVSSIAQIVKQIGTLARQAEQLEGLNLTMDAIEEGLGTVQEVGQFKDKVLSRIERGKYSDAYRAVRVFGNRHGLGLDLPSGRHMRTPSGLRRTIEDLNRDNDDGINLHDAGNGGTAGAVESLDTEEEARAYATATLLRASGGRRGGSAGARPAEPTSETTTRRGPARTGDRNLGAERRSGAKHTTKSRKTRSRSGEALGEAESMREEISLLALATIEAGRTQAFANRLTAEALRHHRNTRTGGKRSGDQHRRVRIARRRAVNTTDDVRARRSGPPAAHRHPWPRTGMVIGACAGAAIVHAWTIPVFTGDKAAVKQVETALGKIEEHLQSLMDMQQNFESMLENVGSQLIGSLAQIPIPGSQWLGEIAKEALESGELSWNAVSRGLDGPMADLAKRYDVSPSALRFARTAAQAANRRRQRATAKARNVRSGETLNRLSRLNQQRGRPDGNAGEDCTPRSQRGHARRR